MWRWLRVILIFATGAVFGAVALAGGFFFLVNSDMPASSNMPAFKDLASKRGKPANKYRFVPNGVEGCADGYGCARPSYDADFWQWVPKGEQNCADEQGCARPLPDRTTLPTNARPLATEPTSETR
jgi:hypothetical protein